MPDVRGKALQRGLALLVGSSVAACLWILSVESRTREAVTLVDNSFAEKADWISRRLAPRGLTFPSEDAEAGAGFRRRTLSLDELTRLYGVPGLGGRQYDPLRILRYRAGLNEEIAWPEHPAGHWTRVTNGDGVREDHEFPAPPPDVFVLVTGDSHTEGVCDNAESYANRLERELLRRRPGRTVEVYNTGMNGYSFYNALGALEAFVAREPSLFISTFYSGNDFVEGLKLHHAYAGSALPPRPRNYWSEIIRDKGISGSALAQGLTQMLFLRENPDQARLALQSALFATAEIQRICQERRVQWIAVYLPSPFDLPFEEWRELREHAARELTLSRADFELANRLGDQLLSTLRERGVEVLDLRPIFREQTQRLYWSDLHLNLRGQQVVADALLPRVEAALSR